MTPSAFAGGEWSIDTRNNPSAPSTCFHDRDLDDYCRECEATERWFDARDEARLFGEER